MTRKYLTFGVYAPMASWRVRNIGTSKKKTEIAPTRSAVIGMICAAMGFRRGTQEVQDMHDGLLFGYKINAKGSLLRDFQTRQFPTELSEDNLEDSHSLGMLNTRTREMDTEKLSCLKRGDAQVDIGTKVGEKWYVQNALYTFAIGRRENAPCPGLEALRDGLRAPQFHMYLGSKACPLGTLLDLKITEEGCIVDALDTVDPLEELYELLGRPEVWNRGEKQSNLPAWAEKTLGEDLEEPSMIGWEGNSSRTSDMEVRRMDRLIDPTNRGFTDRIEHRIWE